IATDFTGAARSSFGPSESVHIHVPQIENHGARVLWFDAAKQLVSEATDTRAVTGFTTGLTTGASSSRNVPGTWTVYSCITDSAGRTDAVASVQFTVSGIPAPLPPAITSLGCSPVTVNTGVSVSCSPATSGPVTSHGWTASGSASPAGGSGPVFSTIFSQPGSPTIAYTACNGAACATQSQTITVNQPAIPPTITSLGCSPGTVNAGVSVSC